MTKAKLLSTQGHVCLSLSPLSQPPGLLPPIASPTYTYLVFAKTKPCEFPFEMLIYLAVFMPVCLEQPSTCPWGEVLRIKSSSRRTLLVLSSDPPSTHRTNHLYVLPPYLYCQSHVIAVCPLDCELPCHTHSNPSSSPSTVPWGHHCQHQQHNT